jgi:hypothetical protein
MNIIKKLPLASLGYQFVEASFLPDGKDEYYLRNEQQPQQRTYRNLTDVEVAQLIRQGNSSSNWSNVLVSSVFHTQLVQGCQFHGLVRIGQLEPVLLSFSELNLPVGLYGSTIVSVDFGDNVAIHNNDYISHYIIGNECIILNVNELLTTSHAKFGNGLVKEGEPESVRIWLELRNENAGRSVLPFDGMLPGDAWLWSKYRDNEQLMKALLRFTEQALDNRRGYYGTIGDRTVVKNCKIIKDVKIGSDAYLKGANKIKNVTINSAPKAKSQVGEGCEIVNGIIGYGCRIFYGVKAVRFVMADWSQLKYGARLINSYLGSNATISCCEVLNSLIFPAHEQHHNNSFLCAALVMGQSNIAAGATIGSNHNSRSPDGELIVGRGFWPGLCVSLKHNSQFASYTMLAKGDYPAELNIPIPFSLVSNDVANDRLLIMPGYWFMYNMYALARNAWKYVDRDKRVKKIQTIEYDYLAPDTVSELFVALELLEQFTGDAYKAAQNGAATEKGSSREVGRRLLLGDEAIVDKWEVLATGFENSKRKVVITKPQQAYQLFRRMIQVYAVKALLEWAEKEGVDSFDDVQALLQQTGERNQWINVGGQLMPADSVAALQGQIVDGGISDWDGVHLFYREKGNQYEQDKLFHALACLAELAGKPLQTFTRQYWTHLVQQAIATKQEMVQNIMTSRAKDYHNPFRNMVYDNETERNKVIGKLEENGFIRQEQEALDVFRQKATRFSHLFTDAGTLQPLQ